MLLFSGVIAALSLVDACSPLTSPPIEQRARLGQLRELQRDYFAALDADQQLHGIDSTRVMEKALALLARDDVPCELEREYTTAAGSAGAGRVQLLLDYTRGHPPKEPFVDAVLRGPVHLALGVWLTPQLAHHRHVQGHSMFPGDTSLTEAFRDSNLWGPRTNQVAHLLCAVEIGLRTKWLLDHDAVQWVAGLGLDVAGSVWRLSNLQGSVLEWARAGLIGHEMRGDDDGTGFVGQTIAYNKLLAGDDREHIRWHWDEGVAAVLRSDHAAAWDHIRAINAAIEAPSTQADLAATKVNDHPRFTEAFGSRDGNCGQDIALSLYGYATGLALAAGQLPTVEEVLDHFERLYAADGADAVAINRAASVVPSK